MSTPANTSTTTATAATVATTTTSTTLLEQNLLKLNKESFNVKFNLQNTKYEAIENIGTGAYGVVCKAINRKTKEKVAIKKIPGAFDCYLIAKRTYREIKILKHLQHENIISIKDIIKPNDSNLTTFKDVYVVFDLMESDLHRVIHSKQELTDDHIKYFLYQIMKALKYIHSAKIIHRDLKPSNILVNENCDLKIGDFGMARSINITEDEVKRYNLTQYVATRWYRAPELIYSCEYSSAIDNWSVGCIFSEMITSKPLFPSKDAFSLLKLIFGYLGIPNKQFLKSVESDLFRNIIFAAATKPVKKVNFRELYPNLNSDGYDLLMKLLAIDPKQRISATEAIEHPYFIKYRDPITETNANSPLDFDFEKRPFMIDNGNNENLVLLKEAILIEAESYVKVNKLSMVPESVKEDCVDSLADGDITSTILKIDEFLENLNKIDTSTETRTIEDINNKAAADEIQIINEFNSASFWPPSTSTTTCSEDSSSINKKSISNDVKSLLKQKLLDVAAQKVTSKESKSKRKNKTRHLNPKKVISIEKPKAPEETVKAYKKDIPIRPKPVGGTSIASTNSNILQPHQIFIHSNQPIIILNTSNLLPAQAQSTKAAPLTFLSTQNNMLAGSKQTSNSNKNIDVNNFNNDTNSNDSLVYCNQSKTSVACNSTNNPKAVDDLTRMLSKHKVNDTSLLDSGEPPVPLIITPRGTADGYSIGVDWDSLLAEIPGLCRNFSSMDDLDNIELQSLYTNDLLASANTDARSNSTQMSTLLGRNQTLDNIDLSNILEQLDSPMIFSPTLN